MVGAAFHAEGGERDGGGRWTSLDATADVSIQRDGVGAFGSLVWRRADPSGGPISDDFGIVVQASAYLPETDWEIFARYDVYIPDPDLPMSDPFNTVTVGANWYIHGQAARFTFDVVYFVDDSDGTAFRSLLGSAVVGYFGSDEPGQTLVRAQFQLLF